MISVALMMAAAVGAEPVTLKTTDYAARYTRAEWLAAYPSAAKAAAVSGEASLLCHASSAGWLVDCKIESEDPAGNGFGEALIKIAQRNRLKPDVARAFGKEAWLRYKGGFDQRNLAGPDQGADWLKRPTPSQLNAVVPPKALEAGISGSATITCNVTTGGALDGCVVNEESPAKLGFGAAALLLAPAFQMKPAMKNGKPVTSKVRIPIAFATNGPAGSAAPVAAARVLPGPPFDRAPSYADLLAAWPKGATEDGKAAMRCRLRSTGLIEDCDFTFVTSPSFDRSSRELAKKFHVTMGSEVGAKDLSNVYVAVAIQFVNPARAATTRSIARPVWVKGPDADIFPSEALTQGIKTGRGLAICTVRADGGLTDCKAASEAPERLGFGAAAVQMAQTMKMTLWGEDGLPTEGASVRLPFQINQAEPEPTAR